MLVMRWMAVLILVGAASAWAQTTQPSAPAAQDTTHYPELGGPRYAPAPAPVPAPAPARVYEEDRRLFEFTIGGQSLLAHGKSGQDSIGFITGNFGFYFAPDWSVNFEGGYAPGTFDDNHHHHHHDDENDGVRAAEALGLIRWHFINTPAISTYGEAGIGGLHADHDFPTGGQEDNALGVAGLGLDFRIIDHFHLSLGGRYVRISGDDWEGHRHGHHGHHGTDAAEIYGGLTFIF